MAEKTRNPTSDEAVAGTWTGSAGSRWQVVDDYPDTSGADELTHGTTAGTLTFGFSAFDVPTGATNISVFVDYYDYKNGSQGCTFGARIKVGGSYFNAGTHNPANGSANRTQRTDTWATNPKSSAAWTVDDVNGIGTNALQAFGYNSGSDASPTITTSSVRVRVTYDPPSFDDDLTFSATTAQTQSATTDAVASESLSAATDITFGAEVVPGGGGSTYDVDVSFSASTSFTPAAQLDAGGGIGFSAAAVLGDGTQTSYGAVETLSAASAQAQATVVDWQAALSLAGTTSQTQAATSGLGAAFVCTVAAAFATVSEVEGGPIEDFATFVAATVWASGAQCDVSCSLSLSATTVIAAGVIGSFVNALAFVVAAAVGFDAPPDFADNPSAVLTHDMPSAVLTQKNPRGTLKGL